MAGMVGDVAAPRDGVSWSPALAAAITARIKAGAAMRAVCREAGMPDVRTVTKWMVTRPEFRVRILAARKASGRAFMGPGSSYCEETAEEICRRLADGEAMVKICADPDMPVVSTAYKWMRDRDDFREAVVAARQAQADALAAQGWEMALAATPATARLTEVQLRQLRWYAGKLSPRVYGPSKPVAAWEAAGGSEPPPPRPQEKRVTLKSFWVENGPDGQTRVRASWYDPKRGQIVEDLPGDWKVSPGEQAWRTAFWTEDEARRERAKALPPAGDPEGWL